jgi:hypothetical protein
MSAASVAADDDAMTDRSAITTALVRSSSAPTISQEPIGESSLSRSARDLRDAARTLRQASTGQHDPEDLARASALAEATLDDLAAGAEIVAYATMEHSRRRRRDGATDGLPLPTARAVSWRLHGLRRELVAARRICSELTRVLDGALRR